MEIPQLWDNVGSESQYSWPEACYGKPGRILYSLGFSCWPISLNIGVIPKPLIDPMGDRVHPTNGMGRVEKRTIHVANNHRTIRKLQRDDDT